MAIITGLIGLAHPAAAGFVPSGDISRADDLAFIQRTLENKMVAERLKAMGYDQSEIQERVAALSDDEMHDLAVQIDSLTPGGTGEAIIAVLVIIILVLLVLRLLGKRVVVGDG